jgi:hypothetical protein
MGKLLMLDPRADVLLENNPLVPGLETVEGKVLGILDNGQANSSPMFDELARLLKGKLRVTEVIVRKKPTHMQGAPEPILDELVSRCDAVITGLGA